VQDALAIVDSLPAVNRIVLLFKVSLLMCLVLHRFRPLQAAPLFRCDIKQNSNVHFSQNNPRVFPATSPPNDMKMLRAELKAAEVMHQFVDMRVSPLFAQRAFASVAADRTIESVSSGAMN
jgi:hypothetical protein